MTKLFLLGTSGYHPSEFRHTACFMLPEMGVVLDAGTAMFRVQRYLRTDHLDIFLTHTHLDHVVGLTFLFDVLYGTSVERVKVHGQSEKLAALERHLFAEELFPARPPIDWEPMADPVELCDQATISTFALDHPGGSLGYRIDWPNKSMAYVTDTTARPDADYVQHIQGVNLLVHECHFQDGWEERASLTGHSCTSSVAEVARQADVGRLMLVHINPLAPYGDPVGLRQARDIFPETHVGTDNMEIDF